MRRLCLTNWNDCSIYQPFQTLQPYEFSQVEATMEVNVNTKKISSIWSSSSLSYTSRLSRRNSQHLFMMTFKRQWKWRREELALGQTVLSVVMMFSNMVIARWLVLWHVNIIALNCSAITLRRLSKKFLSVEIFKET